LVETVSTARLHLLRSIAIGSAAADVLSDEPKDEAILEGWGRQRDVFVGALARRYHDTVTSSDTATAAKRSTAMHMLFEEWNPVGYSKTQVLSVLGAPSQEKKEDGDKTGLSMILEYTWGTLRSTTMRLRLSGEMVVGLDMRPGNG
jgi:hypothetical protein